MYINSATKPPDHSVLCVDVILDKCTGVEFTETATRKKEGRFQYVQTTKYNFENLTNSFMQNKNWLKGVSDLIDKIEKKTQKINKIN